ncbi:VOC family protein [Flammeovirgaceae bacterium SG7u.111]|nr:VOC family protein [Flammeovirgaceae bacterium SG7u.132]WPO34505.1 VOC family protein [Flammeovirgaceae bacterium SG7u.111]
MAKRINGIQQLGVGVIDVKEGFDWYRKHFGMDVKMFEEAAVAELMLPHTAGETRERHAILALNMQGGGGFEIWQHTAKTPELPKFDLQIGDLGICIGKLKSADLQKAYAQFQELKIDLLTPIVKDPSGNEHFYLKDSYGNIWEVVYDAYILKNRKNLVNGGVYGVVIGVKNMEESLKVYKDILGYDTIVYDKDGSFDDWSGVPGSQNKYRRMLLEHSESRNGSFSPMFGPSQIELVQVQDREARDIYEGRIWGDPGFIHLCFDINGMDELRKEVKEKGFPFTVDSAKAMDTFDMGEAAGNFAYIQAPEGTLIEFVETHKIPLLKKMGWNLDLVKRGEKPLPRWMFSMFEFMRVKG